MSRRRTRIPQVYPCIDCGGRGWVFEQYKDEATREPCERCNATGVEP